MSLGREVGLILSKIMLDGGPAPSTKGHALNFRPMSVVAKTARLTKMPFGVEVGFGPGDFVLEGNPAPLKRGHSPHPIFASGLLWPIG